MDTKKMSDQPEKEGGLQYNEVDSPIDANVDADAEDIGDSGHNVTNRDLIGDTTYSQTWTLNTLLGLSNVDEEGWSQPIEEDLCMLWDMTAEKAVVLFLLENSFFKVAELSLKEATEPRLMEIVVGIIGNMCCQSEALDSLANEDDLLDLIMCFISTDDTETVLQVLRIVHAAMWNIQNNSQSLWLNKIYEYEGFGESIIFILKNSLSEHLLSATLDLIILISEIELPDRNLFVDIFNINQLISALCESMKVIIIDQEINSHSENEFKNIEKWFTIMFYIMKKNLLRIADENDEKFGKINVVLSRILKPYRKASNLIPLEAECSLCIQKCIQVMDTLQKNELIPRIEVIDAMLKILINIKEELSTAELSGTSESDHYNDMKQLNVYVSCYWVETLEIMDKDQVLELLKFYDPQSFEKLVEIVHLQPKVKESSKKKLQEIRNVIFPPV